MKAAPRNAAKKTTAKPRPASKKAPEPYVWARVVGEQAVKRQEIAEQMGCAPSTVARIMVGQGLYATDPETEPMCALGMSAVVMPEWLVQRLRQLAKACNLETGPMCAEILGSVVGEPFQDELGDVIMSGYRYEPAEEKECREQLSDLWVKWQREDAEIVKAGGAR